MTQSNILFSFFSFLFLFFVFGVGDLVHNVALADYNSLDATAFAYAGAYSPCFFKALS